MVNKLSLKQKRLEIIRKIKKSKSRKEEAPLQRQLMLINKKIRGK